MPLTVPPGEFSSSSFFFSSSDGCYRMMIIFHRRLDLSFFGAILSRSQAYVTSTLESLSTAFGTNIVVVADSPGMVSIDWNPLKMMYWKYLSLITKLTVDLQRKKVTKAIHKEVKRKLKRTATSCVLSTRRNELYHCPW
jgi:hypothetical protein